MTRTARLAASLAAIVCLAGPAWAEETAGRLAAFDALVRAGKAGKLRAKLEGKGMLGVYSSVESESVDFWLVAEPVAGEKPGTQTLEKAKFLGSGKTDSSGIGELEWTPERPGTYEVEARVRRGSSYVAVPAPLVVLVASHDRPIVLAAIEHTLTDLSVATFMRKDAKDIAASEGAAAALAKVREQHALVYLTGIEEVSLVKTKEWLRLRGFPQAPVFFWNISKQSFSGEKYKTEVVGQLHADFPGLIAGVGGRTEDVNAFLANGVTPYLAPGGEPDPTGYAIGVKTWDKLAPAIARQHEVDGLLQDLASKDVARQQAATKSLTALATGELGYLNRHLRAADVSLASATRLVVGRVRARDAFSASLDMKTSDSTALASLVTAWRSGDASIAASLYRDGASGLAKTGPALERWRGIEVVNRTEPEPGKVVYRLRFLPEKEGAESAERDYGLVRGDDGTWKVDSGDL